MALLCFLRKDEHCIEIKVLCIEMLLLILEIELLKFYKKNNYITKMLSKFYETRFQILIFFVTTLILLLKKKKYCDSNYLCIGHTS